MNKSQSSLALLSLMLLGAVAWAAAPSTNGSAGVIGAVATAAAGGASATAPASAPASGLAGGHAYFDALAARKDVLVAYAMRSQAELDKLRTGAKSPNKAPVTYDAAMDAACFTVDMPVTTDSQQKILPTPFPAGSALFTWDFRFDRGAAWKKQGDLWGHKTWRFDSDKMAWLAVKTDYRAGAKHDAIAELFISLPSPKTAGAGATRGEREIVFPRKNQFYIQPDTWTRVWILLEDMDQPNCRLSAWAADENRDAVQLYERVALVPPAKGLTLFRMEYDTSQDQATNTGPMHSWNRNFVVLKGIAPDKLPALLQRPAKAAAGAASRPAAGR